MRASTVGRGGVVAVALWLALSAGVLPHAAASSAPDVTGKKYSEATGVLNGAGFEPVVSTTVGDRSAWPDCLVAGTRQHNVPPPPNSRGGVRHQVLVSLNCDAAVASATHPGYSAQSQEASAIASAKKSGSR